MKKLLLFLMVVLAAVSASAQDVIVKKDGSTILCKIIQVNGNEVIYVKWSDLNGPQYIMDSSLVSNINYMDGRQDKLNEQTSNAYAPGVQQTGDAFYNDRALLMLDRDRANFDKKILKQIKTLKIIGWTVGPALFVAGIPMFFVGMENNDAGLWAPGIFISACGIATTIGCLVRAHQLQNKVLDLSSAPIIQREFNLGAGTSLSASVDLIRDLRFNQNSLGFGLRFNF